MGFTWASEEEFRRKSSKPMKIGSLSPTNPWTNLKNYLRTLAQKSAVGRSASADVASVKQDITSSARSA